MRSNTDIIHTHVDVEHDTINFLDSTISTQVAEGRLRATHYVMLDASSPTPHRQGIHNMVFNDTFINTLPPPHDIVHGMDTHSLTVLLQGDTTPMMTSTTFDG
jgi:hypothetical protein